MSSWVCDYGRTYLIGWEFMTIRDLGSDDWDYLGRWRESGWRRILLARVAYSYITFIATFTHNNVQDEARRNIMNMQCIFYPSTILYALMSRQKADLYYLTMVEEPSNARFIKFIHKPFMLKLFPCISPVYAVEGQNNAFPRYHCNHYSCWKIKHNSPENKKEPPYEQNLVTVDLGLEWTLNLKTKVLSLDWGQFGQLSVDVSQVKLGNGLVQNLGENIDTNIELLSLAELDVLLAESGILRLVQHDLSKNLVGEGARHDEGRVAGGTSQVNETTLSKEDDVTTVLHEVTVNLWLDVLNALGVCLQPSNVNLDIEVTNVYLKVSRRRKFKGQYTYCKR